MTTNAQASCIEKRGFSTVFFSALAKYKLNFPFKDNGLANFYAPQDGVEMPLSSFVILSKNENIIPSGQKTPVPLGERTFYNIDIP